MIYEIRYNKQSAFSNWEKENYSNWVELIAPLVAPIISSSIEKIGGKNERAAANYQAYQNAVSEKLKAEQSKAKTNTIIGVVVILAAAIVLSVFLLKRK